MSFRYDINSITTFSHLALVLHGTIVCACVTQLMHLNNSINNDINYSKECKDEVENLEGAEGLLHARRADEVAEVKERVKYAHFDTNHSLCSREACSGGHATLSDCYTFLLAICM